MKTILYLIYMMHTDVMFIAYMEIFINLHESNEYFKTLNDYLNCLASNIASISIREIRPR